MAIEWNSYDKVFYPTLEVFLHAGEEGITNFGDKKTNKRPDKHAVVVLRSDLNRLERIAAQEPQTENEAMRKLNVEDFLVYVQKKVAGHSVGPDKPIALGDNLYLIVTESADLRSLVDAAAKDDQGKNALEHPKLHIVCQNPGEFIRYSLDGFLPEEVKFDKVDPNIRKVGIKSVESNELYGEIMQKSTSEKTKAFPITMLQHFVKQQENGSYELYPNQYFIISLDKPKAQPLIGQLIGDIAWNNDHTRMDMGPLEFRLLDINAVMRAKNVLGIRPKDINQAFYFHALEQPHISRIFVTGGPSCGKTIVGYASALAQTLRHKMGAKGAKEAEFAEYNSRFKRILITKSIDLIGGPGRGIGFLPGEEWEKMLPYAQSYLDAHDELDLQWSLLQLAFGPTGDPKRQALVESPGHGMPHKEVYKDLYAPTSGGLIEIQDYAKWRGRTLPRAVIFGDEAQNLMGREIKDINERIGHGSLVIWSGDFENQRDNLTMAATNCGLFIAERHYLGEPYVAVIHLEGSYRDAGAEHASKMKVYR